MELTTNINQVELEITLDGDITPIEVDEAVCYQRNEYITFSPDVYKNGNPFSNYNIDYVIADPDGNEVVSTPNANSVSFELTQLGTYIVTMTFEDTDDNLTYTIIYQVECCDFLTITQTDCNQFTVTNNGTEDVDITITDLFNVDSVGDPIVPVGTTTLAAGENLVVTFDDISLFVADVEYTIGGNPRLEQYIFNNYCLIEECIASYTLDILCAEEAECVDCPDGIDLNRMLALNYAYFLGANEEYGLNNFYSGLEHAELKAQFSDMKGIMDKLYAYCERRGCTGLTGISTTGNVNTTQDCGCHG